MVEADVKGLAREDWKVGGAPEVAGPAANFDASFRLTVATIAEPAAAE